MILGRSLIPIEPKMKTMIQREQAQNTINTMKVTGMVSDTTTNKWQEMTSLGGMNYARTRLLDATGCKTSAKERKVRPPTLQAQFATTGPLVTSRFTSPTSKATSGRTSAYKAVHEAALVSKALLEAQLEAERTVARLSEDKAECEREHKAIAKTIETVQNELRLLLTDMHKDEETKAAEMNAERYGSSYHWDEISADTA